jgi:hypothetical protein
MMKCPYCNSDNVKKICERSVPVGVDHWEEVDVFECLDTDCREKFDEYD